MSDPSWLQTRAGRQLLERTIPDLVDQLSRLNDALDRVATALEASEELRKLY